MHGLNRETFIHAGRMMHARSSTDKEQSKTGRDTESVVHNRRQRGTERGDTPNSILFVCSTVQLAKQCLDALFGTLEQCFVEHLAVQLDLVAQRRC